jgi:N-succinyldiaminopimelate aminotransferase
MNDFDALPPLAQIARLIHSPFARLRDLLAGAEPPAGLTPIDMTIGEPRHPAPGFIGPMLARRAAEFGKYPPIAGTVELRTAIASWIGRRHPALSEAIDPARHILSLNGSREGLFSSIFPAAGRKSAPEAARPAVLLPNPFYQVYLAAALSAQAEPVFLPATASSGFLPDLDAIPGETLSRTAAFYLASPANPQGAAASPAYLERAVALARKHDFMLFMDECYSEIYPASPPPGALEAAWRLSRDFANVIVFQSLSKRSSVPGLRSGFMAGDPAFIAACLRFRNVACPQTPLPIQRAAAALWSDETHVEQNRALYRAKFEAVESILGSRFGCSIPDGAFFLWLDMTQLGGGEAAAATIWKGCGVRVLPGAYLAQSDDEGRNPGWAYLRLALVDDLETTKEALRRIAALA